MQWTDEEIERLVREELTKSYAPVSGYMVSCALVTEASVYLGHNYEHKDTSVFEHAECRAVELMKQAEGNPRIHRIVLAGGGNVRKHKYYIPCFPCSEVLKKYIDSTDDVEIRLLSIEGITQSLTITFKEMMDSYEKLPYSMIEGETFEKIKENLAIKTILEKNDLDFISELAYTGKVKGVGFYLTGSSSGRGAVSNLVQSKTGRHYRDIDIIAVLEEKGFFGVEQEVERILKKHYTTVFKEKRPLLVHQSKLGVVFAKTFYYCGENRERIVEFAWCNTFKNSFSYPAYQERNWFHQLS